MKKVLTIAGSDSSGGAGIQADIKTVTVHNMYAMSVITALTAQNTCGVYAVQDLNRDFVAQQIDCVFKDIRPDAVKIGMVSDISIIEVIAEKLIEYEAYNIVLDPVMVATSGGKLLKDSSVEILTDKLMPLASIITPNIREAEILSGVKIESKDDMEKAAHEIMTENELKCAIMLKGGHMQASADDLLYFADGKKIWIEGEHIDNPNTHGTGCTLSSAIACGLAKGFSIEESVREAKSFVAGAIRAGLDLGKGRGPLNHMYILKQ